MTAFIISDCGQSTNVVSTSGSAVLRPTQQTVKEFDACILSLDVLSPPYATIVWSESGSEGPNGHNIARAADAAIRPSGVCNA